MFFSVGGSEVGVMGVRDAWAAAMALLSDWREDGTCCSGGLDRPSEIMDFLTETVVAGVDAVIATIAISTVSAWLVKAEFVEITLAAVAP